MPEGLDRYLNSQWGNDPESISLAQEWLGYLITNDDRQQKMLMLIGPPRSGKGTFLRVIRGLVGDHNCSSPSLGDLGERFGLESLLDKTVATVGDARIDANSKFAAITERLLSISGGDDVTVDRKFLPPVSGKLGVRFVVATNELPRLRDASGALASRWSLLRFTRSFLGREDKTLSGKLMESLPGIFNWGIEGWKRLMKNGRFTEPASSRSLIEAMMAVQSTIGAFISEKCVLHPDAGIIKDDLFGEWKLWCEGTNNKCGTKEHFSTNLIAAAAGVTAARPRNADGTRSQVFLGIRLKTDEDDSESASGPTTLLI